MDYVTDRQRCQECGWTGLTAARTVMLTLWFIYVFAAIGVMIADSVFPRAHVLAHLTTVPTLVTVLVLITAVKIVPAFFNRCPKCGGKKIAKSS